MSKELSMKDNLILLRPLGLIFLLPTLLILKGSLSTVYSAASHVVISEVQLGGSTTTDEFVELYNPTGEQIDLTGWKIQKLTASGTNPVDLITLSGSINPHGFYLVAHTNYDDAVAEDATYDASTVANDNTVIIRNNADSIIDQVGMNNALTFEGTVFPTNPAANASIERKASTSSTLESMTTGSDLTLGNGEDTDINASDFVVRGASDPQNSSSSVEPVLEATATPTATPIESPTMSPSPTASSTATPTATASATPTNTPEVTVSPTAVASPETASPTASPTATSTPTLSPSSSPTSSPRVSFSFFGLRFPSLPRLFR